MKDLDYYTIMESRIKYYARKYDPQNKLGQGNVAHKGKTIEKTAVREIRELKPSVRKKLQKKLDLVIAMFL